MTITIEEGYTPSLIGRIVEMHALYYSQLVGFGADFEAKVAMGLADFMPRLNREVNSIWRLDHDGKIVGSLGIDGEDLGRGMAHLRWFIVDETARGFGLGKALMETAVRFSDDRQFSETHLWTFKGLDAARRLYERHGFMLMSEYQGDQWGVEVPEQKFVRRKPLL